jgi:hypothetical protein
MEKKDENEAYNAIYGNHKEPPKGCLLGMISISIFIMYAAVQTIVLLIELIGNILKQNIYSL